MPPHIFKEQLKRVSDFEEDNETEAKGNTPTGRRDAFYFFFCVTDTSSRNIQKRSARKRI